MAEHVFGYTWLAGVITVLTITRLITLYVTGYFGSTLLKSANARSWVMGQYPPLDICGNTSGDKHRCLMGMIFGGVQLQSLRGCDWI